MTGGGHNIKQNWTIRKEIGWGHERQIRGQCYGEVGGGVKLWSDCEECFIRQEQGFGWIWRKDEVRT